MKLGEPFGTNVGDGQVGLHTAQRKGDAPLMDVRKFRGHEMDGRARIERPPRTSQGTKHS